MLGMVPVQQQQQGRELGSQQPGGCVGVQQAKQQQMRAMQQQEQLSHVVVLVRALPARRQQMLRGL